MPQSVKELLGMQIPLPVVVMLLVQTIGGVWWGSEQFNMLDGRISSLEMQTVQADKVLESRSSHERRIIILEGSFERVIQDLREIKEMLRGQKTGMKVSP